MQRERRVVVRGVGRGLLLPGDGGEGVRDDVRGHDSLHVFAGRFVDGPGERVRAHHVPRRDDGGFVLPDDGEQHDARATRTACPGETMEGECSCPAEVVHHSDGNMYLMEESGERDVRREHDGYVSGSWSIVRRVICDPQHVQACASAFSVRRSS